MRNRILADAVRVAAALSTIAIFVSALEAQEDCEYRDERTLNLSVGSLDQLDITAGSGGLLVEGREGQSEVRVTATLCASDEARLAALDVALETSGSRAVLTTEYPEWKDSRSGDRTYNRIHLDVTLPANMGIRVADGSGEVKVVGAGAVDIDDGSGSLELVDIGGDVDVEDGSGQVNIRGVQGSVRISDGSGNITVEDVSGSIHLSDGSGPVDIRRVERDVIIDRKGSGMVDVEGVGGDLRVDGTRRNRIRYSDVQGTVDLPPERRRSRDRRR